MDPDNGGGSFTGSNHIFGDIEIAILFGQQFKDTQYFDEEFDKF